MLGEHPERLPLVIVRPAQSRKAPQESRYPFGFALPYRVTEIFQFDSQESTHFSEVFDRPPGRRSAKLCIFRIDVCATLDQLVNHSPMPRKCCVV